MQLSGTSFAAPVVAGAAAMLLAQHPTWTPDQVKGALMVTATPGAEGAEGLARRRRGQHRSGAVVLRRPRRTRTRASNKFVKAARRRDARRSTRRRGRRRPRPTRRGTRCLVGRRLVGCGLVDVAWSDAAWADAAWASVAWGDAAWSDVAWSDAAWADAAWADNAADPLVGDAADATRRAGRGARRARHRRCHLRSDVSLCTRPAHGAGSHARSAARSRSTLNHTRAGPGNGARFFVAAMRCESSERVTPPGGVAPTISTWLCGHEFTCSSG